MTAEAGSQREHRRRSAKWIDIASFAVWASFLALAVWLGPRGPLWVAGIVLSLAGAVLWAVARRQLGGSFSVKPEARSLVTTGLYSRIRHPIYVFGTLAFLAALLALQGLPALIIWVVVGLIQVRRARREDAVLAETFGERYREYCRSTWF